MIRSVLVNALIARPPTKNDNPAIANSSWEVPRRRDFMLDLVSAVAIRARTMFSGRVTYGISPASYRALDKAPSNCFVSRE
jgi:hypothetical protein